MLVLLGKKWEIIGLYALCLLLAYYIALPVFAEHVPAPKEGSTPVSAGYIFAAIIAATILILVLISVMPWVVRYIIAAAELFLLPLSALILLSSLGVWATLSGTAAIILTRILFRHTRFARNLSAIVIGSVATGILAIFFSPYVIVLALLLLTVYDFVAVFVTKHMIKLARSILGEGKPSNIYALGLGDVVFPAGLALSSARIWIFAPLFLLPAALIGVYITLHFVDRYKRGLPALPSISFPLLLAYFLFLTVKLSLFP